MPGKFSPKCYLMYLRILINLFTCCYGEDELELTELRRVYNKIAGAKKEYNAK